VTLEQLRIFVSVAERLHMTRAAEALHITQSAASAAVAALETRHGLKLFDRVGRGLALTDAGRVLLPEARAVLVRVAAAQGALDDLAGLRRGRLAIAASQTLANVWLPPRLAAFRARHPGIALDLAGTNTAGAVKQVLEGEADLGFVEGLAEAPALDWRAVGGDRIGFYVAPDHQLARAPLARSKLVDLAWVLREPGSGTRSAFEQALAAQGLDPDALAVALELPSNEAVLSAVAAGPFVGAVSTLAAQPWVDAGRVAPLAFELPPRPFHLITHRDRRESRAAGAFLALLAGT
jgi:DNA-binding transcriptional LysR family regulator